MGRRLEAAGARVYMPLAVLLLLGFIVRIATIVLYWPAVFENPDAIRFARADPSSLFGDFCMPAGYAVFLKAVRLLGPELAITIAVQHLLGMATAILLYLIVRAAGGARWLALAPAAVVALSGDQIYLEHSLLTEALFTTVVAAGLYAAVRGAGAAPRSPWLAGAGILFALAAVVRSLALVLPAVLTAWLAFAPAPSHKRRLASVAAAVLPAAVLIGGYVGAARLAGG